jgi:hypothetical protein
MERRSSLVDIILPGVKRKISTAVLLKAAAIARSSTTVTGFSVYVKTRRLSTQADLTD